MCTKTCTMYKLMYIHVTVHVFNNFFAYFVFLKIHRKDGVNRLIRIMFREGYYGFAEPLEFRSVIELVEFYSRNSLQPYSHKLDITLQEPVSRLNAYIVENEGAMGTIEEVC